VEALGGSSRVGVESSRRRCVCAVGGGFWDFLGLKNDLVWGSSGGFWWLGGGRGGVRLGYWRRTTDGGGLGDDERPFLVVSVVGCFDFVLCLEFDSSSEEELVKFNSEDGDLTLFFLLFFGQFSPDIVVLDPPDVEGLEVLSLDLERVCLEVLSLDLDRVCFEVLSLDLDLVVCLEVVSLGLDLVKDLSKDLDLGLLDDLSLDFDLDLVCLEVCLSLDFDLERALLGEFRLLDDVEGLLEDFLGLLGDFDGGLLAA
jgi:hypothetical protein